MQLIGRASKSHCNERARWPATRLVFSSVLSKQNAIRMSIEDVYRYINYELGEGPTRSAYTQYIS